MCFTNSTSRHGKPCSERTSPVPTLDGTVKLRIPPGSENGQQLRVRGRGLPKGKSGERGDFHAVLTIQTPRQTTAEERALWEKLRAVSRFNPRTQP